jgi:small ligand-binding sensory domain FIST
MNTFASAISTLPTARAAATEAVDAVRATLSGMRPDLVVVFATPDLMADAGGIASIVGAGLAPEHVLGCTAEAIIGSGREIEDGPALSLWAAVLPDAQIESFALEAGEAPDGGVVMLGWPPAFDPAAPPDLAADGAVILLADPFTFPPEALAGPDGGGVPRDVVGGMASGGHAPGQHHLILDQRVMSSGAVGVGITGITPLVSQGCRPVGPEMTITDGGQGVIRELAGRPALVRVREVMDGLSGDDRRLVEQGVLAGVVIDENRPEYEQGDFLIRGIIGGDPDTGALVVGEHVRVGQVMRLQVRDHESADADLRAALQAAAGEMSHPAGGALVFSCNGRGTHMFPEPHHDALAVRDILGDIPVAGLFCNGEIGPVCGRTHMHGFTATMALFTQ